MILLKWPAVVGSEQKKSRASEQSQKPLFFFFFFAGEMKAACISLLPPRTAAPAMAAAATRQRLQTLSRQSFSNHGGGGGGAPLLHSHSHLHDSLPSPARHQTFDLHDNSSKRMPSFPTSSASCVRDESLPNISNNTIDRWNPSLTDSTCQVTNEDVERRFQQLASSVHKVGMVLDLVQNDVIQLNRAMKEASLDSGSIQQKLILLENPLEQIRKGQNDLKVLLEGSTKSNPDQLSVLNSHTSKLNEISSILSVWPEQVQADLRQLHGDIFRIFTKEMEGIVRAIRSLNSRPAAMQMLADQSCSCNGRPQRNQVLVANGSPLTNQTPIANGRSLMNQTPVANGRSMTSQTPVANVRPQMMQTPVANERPQMMQTPVANGRPKMDQTTVARGRPQMDQTPVKKLKAADPKPNVEQEKVKVAPQKLVGSSNRLAHKEEELANQKVNPQVPTKKAPVSITMEPDDDSEERASCVVLNTEPADLMKEATSEEGVQTVRRARKSKRKVIARRRGRGREAESEAQAAEVEAAAAKRPRRPNPKYHAAQWAT